MLSSSVCSLSPSHPPTIANSGKRVNSPIYSKKTSMRRISLNILAPPPTIECKAIRASRPGKSHPNCLTSVYRGVPRCSSCSAVGSKHDAHAQFLSSPEHYVSNGVSHFSATGIHMLSFHMERVRKRTIANPKSQIQLLTSRP